MAEIKIEDATYERLQQHAKAFVDTPDTVINRALDALENQGRKDGDIVDPRSLPIFDAYKDFESFALWTNCGKTELE